MHSSYGFTSDTTSLTRRDACSEVRPIRVDTCLFSYGCIRPESIAHPLLRIVIKMTANSRFCLLRSGQAEFQLEACPHLDIPDDLREIFEDIFYLVQHCNPMFNSGWKVRVLPEKGMKGRLRLLCRSCIQSYFRLLACSFFSTMVRFFCIFLSSSRPSQSIKMK
jgi:hypothetical protein